MAGTPSLFRPNTGPASGGMVDDIPDIDAVIDWDSLDGGGSSAGEPLIFRADVQ